MKIQHTSWTAGLALGIAVFAGSALQGTAQAPLWLGDWYPSVALDLTVDDNINRSFDGNGEESDLVLEPVLLLEQQFPLADNLFGYTAVELAGAVHADFNGLNRAAPGVEGGIRQPLGEGPRAPVFEAGLGLSYAFYEQDFRSGAEINPHLSLQFNPTERLLAEIGYAYDNRFASDNPVYDVVGHTLSVDAEYVMTEETLVTAGYQYRRGDVLVHQPRNDLGAEIRGRRFPVSTFGSRFDAVNIEDEVTHHLSLGVRYIMSLYTSFHAGLAYEEIRAEGDSYPSLQFTVGVKHLL